MRTLEGRAGFAFCWTLAILLSLLLAFYGARTLYLIAGPVHHPIVVFAAGGAGWAALRYLRPGEEATPWVRLLVMAMAFLPVALSIDLVFLFPRDMNAPLPEALAYYPVAGFVAEVVFHLVPLALVGALTGRADLPLWAFGPAVLAEPLFQVILHDAMDVMAVLVFVHLVAFSAAELWVFRRYGFVAMYGMRLFYYLLWHVLWGTLRIEVLFS